MKHYQRVRMWGPIDGFVLKHSRMATACYQALHRFACCAQSDISKDIAASATEFVVLSSSVPVITEYERVQYYKFHQNCQNRNELPENPLFLS